MEQQGTYIYIHMYVCTCVVCRMCAVTVCLPCTHSFEQTRPDLGSLGVQSNGQTAIGYLLVGLADATNALSVSLP